VVKLSRVEVGGLFGDLVFLDRYATWIATRTDTVPASYPQISRAPCLDRSTGTFDKGKQQIAAEDVVSC
jgi:hypothetical protein